MESFLQTWDRLNGAPYTDGVPPPVHYDMPTYDGVGSSAELQPLDFVARPATEEEVAANLRKKGNTTRLGPQMTDAEMAKFFGVGK
jgi:hypothetical protein